MLPSTPPDDNLSAITRTLTDRDRKFLAATLERIADGLDHGPEWLTNEVRLLVDVLEGDQQDTSNLAARTRALAKRLVSTPAGPEAHDTDALDGVPAMLQQLSETSA